MKAHYYHPDRLKQAGFPVIIDSEFYDVMLYFLKQIEEMVPEAVTYLEELTHEYKTKEMNESFQRMTTLPDNWGVLVTSNSKEAHYLQEKINAWADEIRLEDVFYQALAWWSIRNYYDSIEETSRVDRIAEMKRFTQLVGISEMEYWKNRTYDIPYEERVTLADSCYLDEDDDHIALNYFTVVDDEQNAEIRVERRYFDRYHPFIFAPNGLSISLNNMGIMPDSRHQRKDSHKFHYENFLLYHDRNSTNSREDLPTWSEVYGFGWDPRTTSWSDFEQNLDEDFKEFKKMYRERTENLLSRLGYLKLKEKRNMEHFKWLVRHRMQGWSLRKIAESYSTESITLNEDTISYGIKSAAELVFMKFTL